MTSTEASYRTRRLAETSGEPFFFHQHHVRENQTMTCSSPVAIPVVQFVSVDLAAQRIAVNT